MLIHFLRECQLRPLQNFIELVHDAVTYVLTNQITKATFWLLIQHHPSLNAKHNFLGMVLKIH